MAESSLIVLGVTGGVGSGKSTILSYIKAHYGAQVLELDRVAESLQRKGGRCWQPMLALLGEEVLGPNGELDRRKTAARLFADEDLRRAVNSIVHPAVKEEVRAQIEALRGANHFLVIEAALLLEDNYDLLCDEVWYIFAPEEVRMRRLQESRGYSPEKCRAIMDAQQGDAFFRVHADRVIDNSREEPGYAYSQVDAGMAGFITQRIKDR